MRQPEGRADDRQLGRVTGADRALHAEAVRPEGEREHDTGPEPAASGRADRDQIAERIDARFSPFRKDGQTVAILLPAMTQQFHESCGRVRYSGWRLG